MVLPGRPPSACSKKKKTKTALSFSLLLISYKYTYVLINMSGARLIVFYCATLSMGESVSSFVFCPKSSCAHRLARTKNGFLLFSFLFSRVRVLCVCVGGSFISFFCVCAAPARARVSFVLFDDDDDDDDARDDPTRAAGELIYVHAGRSRGRERQ